MQSKSGDLAIEWDSTPKMQFSSMAVPSAPSLGIYSEETPSNSADSSAFFCNILSSSSPLTQQNNSWGISELWKMQRSGSIGGALDESTLVGGQLATDNSIVSTCSQPFSQTDPVPDLLETSQYNNVSFSSFLKLLADPEKSPADFHHNAAKSIHEGKYIGPSHPDSRLYDLFHHNAAKNIHEGKYIGLSNLDSRLYDLPNCSTPIAPISIDQLSQDIVSNSDHMVPESQAPEDIHAVVTNVSNGFPAMNSTATQALAEVHSVKTRCTIELDFENNFYSALNSQEFNEFEAPTALLSQYRSRKPITFPSAAEEESGICHGTLLPQTKSAISAKVHCLDHNSKEEQRQINLGNSKADVYTHKRNSTESVLGDDHQPRRKSAVLWPSANGYNNLQNSSVLTYDTSTTAPKTATRLALNTNLRQRAKQGSASDPQSIAARHRRERISERLKILQDLVPNGSKVDLVTMLEKAINYVKFLQLQVQVLTTDEYWPSHDMVPTIMRVEDALQAIASAEANRKAFPATSNIYSNGWKNSPENGLINSCERSHSKFSC